MVCHRDRSSSPDSPVRWYLIESDAPMADVTIELLRTHFRQLRLPTMGQEFERLARDAAATNQTFVQFLLGLTEIELETRAANAVATRIKNAEFPVLKDFDTYDFSVLPQLSKPKVLELSRCEWIEHKHNCCLVGSHGTGKTHIAVALGQAACRAGRVRSRQCQGFPRNPGRFHPESGLSPSLDQLGAIEREASFL